MDLHNPLVSEILQQPLLSPSDCAAILARAAPLPWEVSRINDGDAEAAARAAEQCSLATCAHEVIGADGLRQILATITAHNRRCWRAALSGELELNVIRYRTGGHYQRWHSDLFGAASTRKLSFTVQLSDPFAYTGGALEFIELAEPAGRQQGAVVVFPSYAVHRVTPVTSGERVALVGWLHGPPFR